MHTEFGEDEVHFDLYYYFGEGEIVPPELIAHATRVAKPHGDETAVDFISERIDATTWQERQAQFEDVAHRSVAVLEAISAIDTKKLRVAKRVVLAFVPDKGQAGIRVPNEVISAWGASGVDLFVSAWPGNRWTSDPTTTVPIAE